MSETCRECVNFDEGMCKLKPGSCLNYDHFQWSPMIMISASDLEDKYVSRISYDSLLKRAEAAEKVILDMYPLWKAAMSYGEHGRAADLDRIRNYQMTSDDIHLLFSLIPDKDGE